MQTRQRPDDKEQLSQAVLQAGSEADAPQGLLLHGRSVTEVSLVDFLQASPLVGLDDVLVFERDASLTHTCAAPEKQR
ncbi:type II toxin-antitoxin system prevent-host-death family antitoxin [Sphaerotilus sp.]|uniref:type II toxin-antitoxin system prevent-host-death family antitoxin n=1 Tax=Sphaerotilus sp. TaxID=2093942 RepID=UPI002ACE5E76|nr:type II toxin-antitoxin system prevent-host-death family antitoxin [Sphaerotilus sp.]MDZ7856425.1 type II toxin-antitoxin system prevent-host-death family antitoxin [Sphaerotilus sp.]